MNAFRLILLIYINAIACSSISSTSKHELAHPDSRFRHINTIEIPFPEEISGVAFDQQSFAVVGDDETRYAVIWPTGNKLYFKNSIEDVESIDIAYADNGQRQYLVISEDNRSIIDHTGASFRFERRFSEVCGRGIEGLSLKRLANRWLVVVLWEGGYFKSNNKASEDCQANENTKKLPVVATFSWKFGTGLVGDMPVYTTLQVPFISDKEAFRAPDLSWYEDAWIVLLSSTCRGTNKPCNHTWIAKFDLQGNYQGALSKMERDYPEIWKARNWEALDWQEETQQLVIGYDKHQPNQHIYLFRKVD